MRQIGVCCFPGVNNPYLKENFELSSPGKGDTLGCSVHYFHYNLLLVEMGGVYIPSCLFSFLRLICSRASGAYILLEPRIENHAHRNMLPRFHNTTPRLSDI